jgi:hypothetical protein
MQRFHLSFVYKGPKHISTGNSVVFAESIEQAAYILMRERSITEITITKRHHANLPTRHDDINLKFILKQ